MQANLIQQFNNAVTTERKIRPDNPYDFYRTMDIYKVSQFQGYDGAAQHMYDALDLKGYKNPALRNIKLLLVELVRVHNMHPDLYLCYSRNGNEWSFGKAEGRELYNPNGVSRGIFKVIDKLLEQGYIEHKKGFIDRETGVGRRSRMKATNKLIAEYIEQFGLDRAAITNHPNTPLVRLKDEDENLIPFDRTKEIKAMEMVLRGYNRILEQTSIELSKDSDDEMVSTNQKFAYRVFNGGSFHYGGRFAGPWWMYCGKGLRPFITINGNPTVELDYEALHVYLLYARLGVDYNREEQGDPYILESGADRKLIKKVVFFSLNAETSESAWRGLTSELRADIRTNEHDGKDSPQLQAQLDCVWTQDQYDDLACQFLSKHPELEVFLHKGMGRCLMNEDSHICSRIVEILTGLGVPVLTIHDSFIVEHQYEELLQRIMRQSYRYIVSRGSIPLIR